MLVTPLPPPISLPYQSPPQNREALRRALVLSRFRGPPMSALPIVTDRAVINRANSQHSTGPRTEAGKQRSSLNALRHGLTSRIVVMPTEDLEAYESHKKSFTDEYNPQGATEAHLVQSLAHTSWRLNRVAAIEANILKFATMVVMPENDAKAIANLSLHSQRLSRI